MHAKTAYKTQQKTACRSLQILQLQKRQIVLPGKLHQILVLRFAAPNTIAFRNFLPHQSLGSLHEVRPAGQRMPAQALFSDSQGSGMAENQRYKVLFVFLFT